MYQDPVIDEDHFKGMTLMKGNMVGTKASSSFGPTTRDSVPISSPKKSFFPFKPAKKNAASFSIAPSALEISNYLVDNEMT